ncbi:MAG: ribonuclease J [Tenericutes bacterium]|nr:ribonuclease J [Mycoplasmatota bacterium]
MNKIRVFSLGGLNENGKNLYVIEINNRILLFDAGLKYASEKMLGVDYVIPDFEYLLQNKKRIVGLFISHAHYENMGAVTDLLKQIPEIHIFATNYTSKILEIEAKEAEISIRNLHIIKPHRKIDFKEFSVFPFSVSHSVPESVGFSINTPDGAIVYMGDYVIDSTMKGAYDMDLGKLAYIGKQGVLLLMQESVFSEKTGFTSPNHKLDKYFKNAVEKSEGRLIFSILPLHLLTIQNIFDAVKGTDRKVVVMGKYLQTIIEMAIREGYLDVPNGMIGDLKDLKEKNTVILVSNDREAPYYNLSRIVNGYDKYVSLEENDSICFADPSYEAQELTSVKIKNEIAIHGINIFDVPKNKNVRLHASSQDLMLMVKIFNPKYYMPIKGEYRYQVANAKLASLVGIPNENIFLKENGDVVYIEDGTFVDKGEHIKVDDILIDGKSSSDVGELVLKDREMLGNNGLILISATVDKKTKQIINGPEVLSRGFIFAKDNLDVIEEIKKKSLEIIKNNTHNGKYADYSKIRNDIRDDVGSYLYKLTESKPVILTVIQEM